MLLLIQFMLYYGSLFFFSHVHVDSTGVYVHAHPSKKTQDAESHSHTSSEIQIINDLTSFTTDTGGITTSVFDIFISPFVEKVYFLYAENVSALFPLCSLLRAPPRI